jgi:Na+/proline symporter
MLFVTGVVVVIIALVVSWIFGVPQIAGLTGWVGLLISQIGSAFGLVFVLATIARTYRQLTEDEAATAAE